MSWQRGDVVLCRVPMPSTQLQQFKIRPAIVVSADSLNQIIEDVMVAPCTSNTSRLTSAQVLIAGDDIAIAGIRTESVIRCESIFTLNQQMILRKLGSLSSDLTRQLNDGLAFALQLQ